MDDVKTVLVSGWPEGCIIVSNQWQVMRGIAFRTGPGTLLETKRITN